MFLCKIGGRNVYGLHQIFGVRGGIFQEGDQICLVVDHEWIAGWKNPLKRQRIANHGSAISESLEVLLS